MHIMSFEEFLENGKPEMSVIIQRVADRYKKNYKKYIKETACSGISVQKFMPKRMESFSEDKGFRCSG